MSISAPAYFKLIDVTASSATVEVSYPLSSDPFSIVASLDSSSTSINETLGEEFIGRTISGSGVAEGTTILSVSESSFVISEFPIRDVKKAKLSVEHLLPSKVAHVRIALSELQGKHLNVRATIEAGEEAHSSTFVAIKQ